MAKSYLDFEKDYSHIGFESRHSDKRIKRTWVETDGLEDFVNRLSEAGNSVRLVAAVGEERLYNIVECGSDDEMIKLVRDCVNGKLDFDCIYIDFNIVKNSCSGNIDPMKQEFVTLVKGKDAI